MCSSSFCTTRFFITTPHTAGACPVLIGFPAPALDSKGSANVVPSAMHKATGILGMQGWSPVPHRSSLKAPIQNPREEDRGGRGFLDAKGPRVPPGPGMAVTKELGGNRTSLGRQAWNLGEASKGAAPDYPSLACKELHCCPV